MTEKKEKKSGSGKGTQKKKSEAPAQVRTGAWWKSAIPLEKQEESIDKALAECQPAPQEQEKAEAEKRPRKAGTGVRARRKKAAGAVEAQPPESGHEQTAAPSAGEQGETASQEAPQRKRPARKGRGKGGRPENKSNASPQEASPAQEEPRPEEAAERAEKAAEAPREAKGAEPDERGARGLAAEALSAPEASEPSDPSEPPEVPEEADAAPAKSGVPPVYKLLVNAEEPEECRVALLENGRLESFQVSTVECEATKNNIYKGRIVSIEPNLQVAFVDIGTGKNGFLPFNEIHPEYYREDLSDRAREFVAQQRWKNLKIEEVMQKGQEVLVQVVKEVTGHKGASLTTYLSLPGRQLVLLPGSDSAGISRKIAGDARRGELREMMSELELPEGIGYIVRTASADINRENLKEDLDRLLSLWTQIRGRGQREPAPALIYQERDTVTRFLRDHFFPEIQEIIVDNPETLQQVRDFVQRLPPEQRSVQVRQHKGAKPIFNQHNIEEQIESIYRPQVQLPSGGSLVIEQTEALVAIDVNSGRTSKNSDFEDSIFQANMEAAEELARQLRLRDLGGLIVVDFIDMRSRQHIHEVECRVRASMKRDKAKVDICPISRFGLMQISRQKMGAPTARGSYITCPYCEGRSVLRSVETLALYYLRRIQTGIIRKKIGRVSCQFPLEVAQYLLNRKRDELAALERQHKALIDIVARPDMLPAQYEMEFLAPGGEN